MKANELRVGNWVNNNEEDYQITSATIAQLERGDSTAIAIPLTEEWLIKFGFEKTYDEFVYDKANLRIEYIIWADDEPEWKLKRFYGNTFSSHSTIKTNYVHQLQNLYFALTGEELTIKIQ